MDDERLFYLAFNFDSETGKPIIYLPYISEVDESLYLNSIYEHFFHCIKEYDYIEAIPPLEISKEIFGEMFYGLKDGE